MLEQARKRTDIEWVLEDFTSVAFDREFDLIVMTGHTFQVLVIDPDLRASLMAVSRALTKEGRFAFETRNPLARAWEKWTPSNAKEVTDASGATVRMTTQVVTPFDGNTISFTHTFSSPDWVQPQVSRSTLRFLDVPSLASFLAEAGLVIEEQFGDWDRGPLAAESPEIITIARLG